MLRKPIVIVDGRFQQLQAGDSLDATVAEVDGIQRVNGNAGALAIGQVVYVSASGQVDKARANAVPTSEAIALVKDASIAAGQPGSIQTDGVLVATTGQWDAVTGQTGGLTPGAVYFLSAATAGLMTTTAPSAVGELVVRLGKAMSETEFEITIEPPVLL